jgi:hypothetical protein
MEIMRAEKAAQSRKPGLAGNHAKGVAESTESGNGELAAQFRNVRAPSG